MCRGRNTVCSAFREQVGNVIEENSRVRRDPEQGDGGQGLESCQNRLKVTDKRQVGLSLPDAIGNVQCISAVGEDGDGTRCLAGRLSDDSDEVMKGACHGVKLCDIVAGRAKKFGVVVEGEV